LNTRPWHKLELTDEPNALDFIPRRKKHQYPLKIGDPRFAGKKGKSLPMLVNGLRCSPQLFILWHYSSSYPSILLCMYTKLVTKVLLNFNFSHSHIKHIPCQNYNKAYDVYHDGYIK
jgi:hypothetical protein